jgi:hypothetical protein
MMFSRNNAGFLLTSMVGIVLIAILTTVIPFSTFNNEEGVADTMTQPARFQNTDPELMVPESTMVDKPARYVHHWDNNPVATIPESTMREKPQQYVHNWDDNPVATIPESTMGK